MVLKERGIAYAVFPRQLVAVWRAIKCPLLSKTGLQLSPGSRWKLVIYSPVYKNHSRKGKEALVAKRDHVSVEIPPVPQNNAKTGAGEGSDEIRISGKNDATPSPRT